MAGSGDPVCQELPFLPGHRARFGPWRFGLNYFVRHPLGSVVNLRSPQAASKPLAPVFSGDRAGNQNPLESVVAGKYAFAANGLWIPAFAGMTVNMTTLPRECRQFKNIRSPSVCFRLMSPRIANETHDYPVAGNYGIAAQWPLDIPRKRE